MSFLNWAARSSLVETDENGATKAIIMAPLIFWKPRENITTYELSVALGVLLAASGGAEADWEKEVSELPPNVSRHFEVSK